MRFVALGLESGATLDDIIAKVHAKIMEMPASERAKGSYSAYFSCLLCPLLKPHSVVFEYALKGSELAVIMKGQSIITHFLTCHTSACPPAVLFENGTDGKLRSQAETAAKALQLTLFPPPPPPPPATGKPAALPAHAAKRSRGVAEAAAAADQAKITAYGKTEEVMALTKQDMRTELAHLVTDANLPTSIVESPALRKFVTRICPRVKEAMFPSRRTFMRHITFMAAEARQKLKARIARLKKAEDDAASHRRLAISFDGWEKHGRSVIGVNVHGFDSESKRYTTIMIGAFELPSPHTADRIATLIGKVLADVGIRPRDIRAVVVDGAANVQAAARELLQGAVDKLIKASADTLLVTLLYCFHHNSQMVVKNAIGSIDADIAWLRKMVSFFVRH